MWVYAIEELAKINCFQISGVRIECYIVNGHDHAILGITLSGLPLDLGLFEGDMALACKMSDIKPPNCDHETNYTAAHLHSCNEVTKVRGCTVDGG